MQVAAMADYEPRMLLKTIRDGDRAGLSSGLIRRGSRAYAEDRTRPQLQVTDHADLPRTHALTRSTVQVQVRGLTCERNVGLPNCWELSRILRGPLQIASSAIRADSADMP